MKNIILTIIAALIINVIIIAIRGYVDTEKREAYMTGYDDGYKNRTYQSDEKYREARDKLTKSMDSLQNLIK